MTNRFANGARAWGVCDVCGFRFDLKKLKSVVIKTKPTQILACAACWTPDQPQLLLGTFPVSDPQAIRNPRPDTNTWYADSGSRNAQWGWAPVGGASFFDDGLTPNWLTSRAEVGVVTIT